MIRRFICPVCAYSEMPWDPEEEGSVCPCCGIEFGYHDADGVSHRLLRDKWVAAGCPWFSPYHSIPEGWNGRTQLIRPDIGDGGAS